MRFKIQKFKIIEKFNGFIITSIFAISSVKYRIEIMQTEISDTTFSLISYDEDLLRTLGRFSYYDNNKIFVLSLNEYPQHNLHLNYWEQYDLFNYVYKILIKMAIGI